MLIFIGPKCTWSQIYGSAHVFVCHYVQYADIYVITYVTPVDDDTNWWGKKAIYVITMQVAPTSGLICKYQLKNYILS